MYSFRLGNVGYPAGINWWRSIIQEINFYSSVSFRPVLILEPVCLDVHHFIEQVVTNGHLQDEDKKQLKEILQSNPPSSVVTQHFSDLQKVIDQAVLTIHLQKSRFWMVDIKFLGHMVQKGVTADPDCVNTDLLLVPHLVCLHLVTRNAKVWWGYNAYLFS